MKVYRDFLPAAFALAQRALAAAAILALAAALIVRLAAFLTKGLMMDFALAFDQRSFCAAAMASRPASLNFRLFRPRPCAGLDELKAAANSSFSFSILSTISAACLSSRDASPSNFIGREVYAGPKKEQLPN
jgi:hypothetical protein